MQILGNIFNAIMFNIRIPRTRKIGDFLNKPVLSEFWIVTVEITAKVSKPPLLPEFAYLPETGEACPCSAGYW